MSRITAAGGARRQQSGFALVVSLILLTILTMVAVIATRGSGLEVQMAGNSVARIEALDVSESTRRPMGEVIDAHTFARGWPVTLGGTVPVDDFDFELPAGLLLCGTDGEATACDDQGEPRSWYLGNSESGTGFDPAQLDRDAELQRASTETLPIPLQSRMAIYKLVTDLNPGAGSAMVAGYEGVGKSAAAGGGRVFYYVSSTGVSANDNLAEAETGANYRYVIQN